MFSNSSTEERSTRSRFRFIPRRWTCTHRRLSASQINRIKKKLFKLFKELGLQITLETNLTRVEFLDVDLNLHQETFEPFRKPNDTPIYVHKLSNHPPHIAKNLPTAIEKRLSEISSNKSLFDKHKPAYENALKVKGHQSQLKYSPPSLTQISNQNKIK